MLAIAIPIAGTAWSEDWDPLTALGVKIEKVYEGADKRIQDESAVDGRIQTRGIYGWLIVHNKLSQTIWVSWGHDGKNLIGVVPADSLYPFPTVAGFPGAGLKLWASSKWVSGTPRGYIRQKTVSGEHHTYS